MRTLMTVVLTLVIASAAHGKGIVSAQACGTDGCEAIQGSEEMLGGASANPPAKAEPFVRLRLKVGVPGQTDTMRMIFLPRSGISRIVDDPYAQWTHNDDPGPLRQAARRVEPFPAAALPDRFISPIKTAPATPASPRPAAPATSHDAGSTPWWLALIAVPLVLAAVVARRRWRPALRA